MSCTVIETLNGEWELTLVHDIDGIHKYDGIDGCQRSLLPGFNLRQQLVRDRRYHALFYHRKPFFTENSEQAPSGFATLDGQLAAC